MIMTLTHPCRLFIFFQRGASLICVMSGDIGMTIGLWIKSFFLRLLGLGPKVFLVSTKSSGEQLEEIGALIDKGAVKPPPIGARGGAGQTGCMGA